GSNAGSCAFTRARRSKSELTPCAAAQRFARLPERRPRWRAPTTWRPAACPLEEGKDECEATRGTARHFEGAFRAEHASAPRSRVGQGPSEARSRPEEAAHARRDGEDRRRAGRG